MTMKRLTTTLFTMCLFFACTIQAQTIKMGDKFFDGATLFKVQEIRMGKYVSLEGSNGLQMTLEKVDGKQGEYSENNQYNRSCFQNCLIKNRRFTEHIYGSSLYCCPEKRSGRVFGHGRLWRPGGFTQTEDLSA